MPFTWLRTKEATQQLDAALEEFRRIDEAEEERRRLAYREELVRRYISKPWRQERAS